ncbi:hypothetical protein E4U42_004641 [Claviceps africana]|uniref:Uncharacterized protein n=1 Tax=Claviceps africana TaxID=83212 RepID=A0A8K0J4Q7_9HYPO|nr:hypothetical protein E4U42_004641 [Claviceps africana]
MDKSTRPSQSQPSEKSSRSNPGMLNPRRFEESWIEVASQPSSSSLSSIGEEIVTTGLRVRGPNSHRPRPRPRPSRLHGSSAPSPPHPRAAAGSQDEYDESESDDGKLLASSAEHDGDTSPEVVEPVSETETETETEAESDGDDATALGRATSEPPVFRPQPNAFSHPPPSVNRRQRSHSAATTPSSSMPPHPHSGFTRPSFAQRSQTRVHRARPSFMAPSAVREDNDAALRASLTTLLSCAAAARGLPKSKEEPDTWPATRHGVGPSDQPMELRFVPESELMNHETRPGDSPDAARAARQQTSGAPPPSRSPARAAPSSADKSRRSMSAGRSPRAAKKKKVLAATPEDNLVSPTLLTWVVSAGVVVLVSVVGFGAGYVIGREVGRQEAQDALSASISAASETSHTGREVIRTSSGLRKLQWGAGAVSRSIVAQA